MRITNKTNHRIPRKWLEKMLNHLGVNPEITIEYADNPEEIDPPNYHEDGDDCDGLATEDNRVYIYVGRWREGKYEDWHPRYLKWVLCHELRHQFYFYHQGNGGDPWKGLPYKERIRREERACNRFANLTVGVADKEYPTFRKDVHKIKNTTAR